MNPWLRMSVGGIALCLSVAAGASDLSLSAAINAALLHDRALQAQAAKRRADQEQLPRARAAWLPQVALQGSESRNRSSVRDANPLIPDTTTNYNSKSQSLTVTQALFNQGARVNFNKAEATIDLAEAEYASAVQQSIDRAVAAYSEKLRLETELDASRAELLAKEQRLKLTRRLLEAGQASLVALKTSEAEFAQEQARNEDVGIQLQVSNRELTRLTGLDWSAVLIQRERIRVCGARIQELVEKQVAAGWGADIELHPDVAASRSRYAVAELEAKRREGDHYPTLNLIASVSNGQSASDVTIGREIRTSVFGLQFNVPIYSGGGVSSGVREAIALQEKAAAELENARLIVGNDRARTQAQVRSSLARLNGDIAAYDAAELGMQLENRRFDARVGSEIDLQAARSKMLAATAKLTTSTVKAIADYSKSRLANGDLAVDALVEFSQVLDGCFAAANGR